MTPTDFPRASKYADLDTIYAQCSGPGGLSLTEFLADRMKLEPGMCVLDLGSNRGYQSCFLAKEYGVRVVAVDPWDDREDGRPMAEHVRDNAEAWGVHDLVLPLHLGVPDTPFVAESFDAVYSTTTLEMVRWDQGDEGYVRCMQEVRRVLRPGGVFGLAEPMHTGIPIPDDLLPFVSQEPYGWKDCFRSLEDTVRSIESAGLEIVDSGLTPDARHWWKEFAVHDPFCKAKPEEDPRTLEVDGGRWATVGYVVSRARVSGS